jgi:hypothetical protein
MLVCFANVLRRWCKGLEYLFLIFLFGNRSELSPRLFEVLRWKPCRKDLRQDAVIQRVLPEETHRIRVRIRPCQKSVLEISCNWVISRLPCHSFERMSIEAKAFSYRSRMPLYIPAHTVAGSIATRGHWTTWIDYIWTIQSKRIGAVNAWLS